MADVGDRNRRRRSLTADVWPSGGPGSGLRSQRQEVLRKEKVYKPEKGVGELVLDLDVLKAVMNVARLDEDIDMTAQLDPEREEACKTRLREYLTRIGQQSVDNNVDNLLRTEGGIADKFVYMSVRAPARAKERLLVSGCSIGSELITARRYGYKQIVGTEVTREYVEMARERLRGMPGFEVVLYDGVTVPFPDRYFSAVVSSHIIEHTPSPYRYLREQMRVLEEGGILYLEFPDRYHPVELHTNLPSVDAYPLPLRSLLLRYRSSKLSPYSEKERRQFAEIRETLQPMSLWQIRSYLLLMGLTKSRVIHQYQPVPGYQRALIMK